MATVIILSHKAQNPLTANDHHTMATVITSSINIITYGPKSARANEDQPKLLVIEIDINLQFM
jgi:hypothetical protein